MPIVAPTRWNFISRLSNTVKENRSQLLPFFKNILEFSDNWADNDVEKARGFWSFLEDPETVFLVHVFSNIFGSTYVLYDIRQNDSFDVMYCKEKIDEFHNKLLWEKNTGFNRIWDVATSGQKPSVTV